MSPLLNTQETRHAVFTCYDDRIDGIVNDEARVIRSHGELLNKAMLRPPGGPHILLGKAELRRGFYEICTALRDIAGIDVFHIFPHTNCQYCGLHLTEELGSGTKSDLRFHLESAQKILDGLEQHFRFIGGRMPELDVRVILTIDQRLITIQEGYDLLPNISAEHGHGEACVRNNSHHCHAA